MRFRCWSLSVLLVVSLASGWATPTPGAEDEPIRSGYTVDEGFIRIFDGKTLDGWHAVPKDCESDWSVHDGVIVGHGSADRLAYLVWKDERLTDFELTLQYRLPGEGNTGVEIRSQPDRTGKRPFEGYHADLGHVGIGRNILGAWDFHFARREEYPCPRGTRLVIDEDGDTQSSEIRGAFTAADVRQNKWNDVRIIARGNHFQFFINGKLASEFTDNAEQGRLDRGAIGLQIHDKGMRVEFRDICLRTEAIRTAEIMLLYQRDNGGWPKNYDKTARLNREAREAILAQKSRDDTTFDNGATHSELRHLAKVYQATGDERYRRAFLIGLDFMLAAQYENGGWPQCYPKPKGYSAHITFNDDAMIGVMRLLRAIAQRDALYELVDRARRQRCRQAIEKGVLCILNCQIEVEGKKTAWCAQHDWLSLVPQKARSYELPSLSGSESVGIVRYLMGIDEPNEAVIDAIQSAIAWFDEAKLSGLRLERKKDESAPKGYDKVVVKDPTAPSIWARFHEIGSNKPIFCSRDGIPRDSLADISYERRNGYSWLSSRASSLLSEDYPAWQEKWAPGDNVSVTGSE